MIAAVVEKNPVLYQNFK